MDMDLDIDNYELKELLDIFKLDYDFTMDDLKKAKKTALKTHPDKSGLDQKYFIFFSKAYNIIYNIYRFRNKTIKKVKNVDYINDEIDEGEKTQLIEKISKFKTAKDFNEWFNEVFEKVNDQNSEKVPLSWHYDISIWDGYCNYLGSNNIIELPKNELTRPHFHVKLPYIKEV